MENKMRSITKSVSELNVEIKKKIAGYVTAGFGVVAGLAWNDAIKAFIEEYFPQTGSNILAKFLYALIITIAVVIVSLYLVKLLKTDPEKES